MIEIIKKEISNLESKLNYPLTTMEWENHWWGHRINTLEKYHEIAYPKGVCLEKLYSKEHILNYLHELIHAYYSESIHPLFGGFAFDDNYPDEVINVVSEAYKTACDWFIWSKIVDLASEEGCQEIDESFYRYIDNYDPEIHILDEQKYIYGLILALNHKYLDVPLRDESENIDDTEDQDELVRLAEVYISVNPIEPTIDKLEELINSLLALGYSYRVKSTDFIDFPTWVVEDI